LTSQDYAKAFYWFTKSADQGYASGQFGLGQCYWYGDGVAMSKEKAIYWFEKAAAQGNANAKEMLRRAGGPPANGNPSPLQLYN
jgi:TPR repeat protein